MSKKLKCAQRDSTLLNLPLCSIPLRRKDSVVLECIEQVRQELRDKGIKFNFHFWVSDDWFCPDGIAGIAIPFYLLNLHASEVVKKYLGEAEGASREECLKLIRHEVGHAIDNAYNLRACQIRATLFGNSNAKYPKEYTRKPFSKNFVRHIKENYAQSHPDEDWAETFAVWLTPHSNWQEKYKGWPALKKLNYVDQRMSSLHKCRPVSKSRDTVDEVSTLGITLKSYIRRKLRQKNKYNSPLFGQELYKVFHPGSKSCALDFINLNEKSLCLTVAKETNQYQYIVRNVLKELKNECRKKKLTLRMPAGKTRTSLIGLLNTSTHQYIQLGKNKVIM